MQEFLVANKPWSFLFDNNNVKWNRLEHETSIVIDENVSIDCMLVPHRADDTLAFSITTDEKSLFFCPDTDHFDGWKPSLKQILKTHSFVLIDGTFFNEFELKTSLLTIVF